MCALYIVTILVLFVEKRHSRQNVPIIAELGQGSFVLNWGCFSVAVSSLYCILLP